MKYLIEFAVLFSVVVIYSLQLANIHDDTLGNLIYIPLIILSLKYPMGAFVGLVGVILYNMQVIEGFDGSRMPTSNTSTNNVNTSSNSMTTMPSTSQPVTTTSAEPTTTTTTTTTGSGTNSGLSSMSNIASVRSASVNPLIQSRLQQQQDTETQLIKNLVSKIKQLRAANRISEIKEIINQCNSQYGDSTFNEALAKCGILDNDGNLLPPFATQSNNGYNTENYQISGSMLPLTGDQTTMGSVSSTQTNDRISAAENLQPLSDRNNTSYQSSASSSNDPAGTSTSTEGYTNLY